MGERSTVLPELVTMRLNPDITRYYVSFLLRMVQREENTATTSATDLLDRLEEQVLGMLQRRDNLTPEMVDQQAAHLREARRLLSITAGTGSFSELLAAIDRFGENDMVDHVLKADQARPRPNADLAAAQSDNPQAAPDADAPVMEPSPRERRWVAVILLLFLTAAGALGWLGGWLARPKPQEMTAFCPSTNCYASDWVEVPQAGRNVVSFDHGLASRPSLVQVWFSQSRVGGTSTLLAADMTGNPRAIEVDERRILITILPDGSFRLYDPVKGSVESLSRGYIRVVALR